jgi:hypothetical protein
MAENEPPPMPPRLRAAVASGRLRDVRGWLDRDYEALATEARVASLALLAGRCLDGRLDADATAVVVHHFVHQCDCHADPVALAALLVGRLEGVWAAAFEASCALRHLAHRAPLVGDERLAAVVARAWLPRLADARADAVEACLLLVGELGLASTNAFDEAGGVEAVARVALRAPPATRAGGEAFARPRALAFAVLGAAARTNGHLRAKVRLAAWRPILGAPPREAAPLAEAFLAGADARLAPAEVLALRAAGARHGPTWTDALAALAARYGADGAAPPGARVRAPGGWEAADHAARRVLA